MQINFKDGINMKRIIALVLCVLALSFALVACGSSDDAPKGMKRVNADSKMYSLYVPEEWVEFDNGTDMAFAQAQASSVTGNSNLQPESVNAAAWPISEAILKNAELTAEEKIEKAYEAYVSDYKFQLGEDFKEVSEFSEEESVREDAKTYVFTAKHSKIYYKYYMTVIVEGSYYYVVTFNFPQKNLTENSENGGFNETLTVDEAEFGDDNYKDTMDEILNAFKTNG